MYTIIKTKQKLYYKTRVFTGDGSIFRNSQPSRLEAGGAARAAGAARVAGVAGEGRVTAGAVAAMLAVLVPVLATSVVAARRRRRVRRRRRRCRGPEPFPAAAVRFGLQEVHEAHG
jgi:hypothetical protein